MVDGGTAFGRHSDQFIRINFATSQQILDSVLQRVVDAVTRNSLPQPG
jgi:cystathionine beta-lyase